MSERQGETAKGLATLVCWSCKAETENVPGQMNDGSNVSWFLVDGGFTCPNCETEDDYAWSDFEESA